MRVSHKYLENFHVSRTSRELVAKYLNRFKTFMQMFSSNYFARLSRDCRNNENENMPHSRESRETLSRMSCDCRATVARQSRGIFSKLDRNSRICRINVHLMRMQRKKVQVGKDQEKAQSEKDSHSKNRGGKKTKLTIRYLYHETIVSRMGSYFPNRWPLSYLNLTKNMKTYIRRQQHKKFFKHQDIKQKEPPQKYRLGTISNTKLLAGLNRFYMAITSPSASAVVHNI